MRHRVFFFILLLILLPVCVVQAETVSYGDTVYVYPETKAAQANFTLSVEGTSLDPVTLQSVAAPLEGAVFALYTKDAKGNYTPYTDPAAPGQPLTIISGQLAAEYLLPQSIDLYLRQESTPEGYSIPEEFAEYRLLQLPETITVTNRSADMQGIWITLYGTGPLEEVPLAGIPFTLSGEGQTYSLKTDENGMATLTGIAPGTYTLRQQAAAEGYHMDEPEIDITVIAHEPLHLRLTNSQDGTVTLRTLGLAIDGDHVSRLLPINRTYTVYAENGDPVGTLAAGDSLSLPASQEGITYTLCLSEVPQDGYAADEEAHTVVLYPGQTAACQTVVQSTKGFFTFSHVSSGDGAPVAGGSFMLLDASGMPVLTFTADSDGRYASTTPLPMGDYTLRQAHAAAGHLYTSGAIPLTIEPYFGEEHPIAQASFASDPLPQALLAPQVEATIGTLPSLFDEDVQFQFSLRAFADAQGLVVSEPAYDFALPDIAGLTIIDTAPDGMTVSIARRLPLSGVEEIESIVVAGTVSYAVQYPVDAAGTLAEIQVSMPFETTVAVFAPPETTGPFAAYGHVTDAYGEPVVGMRVTVEDESGRWVTDEMMTDIFGAYAFADLPTGARVIFHAAEGYGVKSLQSGDAVVLPLRTVTGRVVTEGGIDGYPVTVTVAEEAPVTPDAAGRFAVTGMFAEDAPVEVAVQGDILYLVQTEDDEVVVYLYAPAAISGVAFAPEGTPVAGLTVTARSASDMRVAQTDETGAYEIGALFPGEYTVAYAAPNGYILQGDAMRRVTLAAGEQLAGEDVQAMQPARIVGTLMDGDMPYAGVDVALAADKIAVTDEEGTYAFEGLTTGEYTVHFDLPEDALLLDEPEPIAITASAQQVELVTHAVRPARLEGRIWQDENDDGMLGAGESGVEGVAISLVDEQGETAQQVRSAQNGTFAFEGLMPGTYRIEMTLPEGMIFAKDAPGTDRMAAGVDDRTAISGAYTVTSGEQITGLIAGAVPSGLVEGSLWMDLDGDGMRGEAEPPAQGMQVVLLQGDTVLGGAVSDAQGTYRFANLRAGDYTVRIVLQTGYMFTRQPSDVGNAVASQVPTTDDSSAEVSVSLRRWRLEASMNAGIQQTAVLRAHVWFDAEATGINPGSSGYAGMTVQLLDAAGRTARTQETDDEGNVAFEALRPGTYRLAYVLPEAEGWGFTRGVAEETAGQGQSEAIVLVGGAEADAAQVGLTRLGSIAGIAFEDANYNGIRDDEEPGLQIDVALLDGAGNIVQQTRAAADGSYRFARLLPGLYSVRFTLEEGYAFTLHRTDAPSYNSDVQQTQALSAQTDAIYLPVGEALLLDAGAYRVASVSGKVWHDIRNNGLYTSECPPLEGLPVALMQGGDVYLETLTDAEGNYRFDALAPGAYAIRISLAEDMRFTASAEGGSAIVGTDQTQGESDVFALGNGERKRNLDVGAIYTGAAGGRVTSLKDESGLAGVTVTLSRGGQVVQTVQTDEAGMFRMSNLRPGAAQLAFTMPDGWTAPADAENPKEVVIPQRDVLSDVDFACIPEATLAGTLWLDGDADGVWDESEVRLLGVSIELYVLEEDMLVLQTIAESDVSGYYLLDKLLPGTYVLRYSAPQGIVLYGGSETEPFDLAMGETVEDVIPAYIASSISGVVWEDLEPDGLRGETEPLLPEVTVELVNPGVGTVMQTVTDEAGKYSFEDIPPMECAVRFILPEGYMFTEPVSGGSVAPLTDAHVAQTDMLTLQMGDHVQRMDAGVLRHTRIGDLVWLDINGNGLQDTDEPGITGIYVELWSVLPSGDIEPVAETTTDINGHYRFDAVRPGTYRVVFTLGSEYLPTMRAEGLDQINSKLPWENGNVLTTDVFSAPSGRHQLTIDAGLVTWEMADRFGWIVEDGSIWEE